MPSPFCEKWKSKPHPSSSSGDILVFLFFQNSPACTKSVRVFKMSKLDTIIIRVSNLNILKTWLLLVIVQFHHFEDPDTFSDSIQLQHFEDSDPFQNVHAGLFWCFWLRCLRTLLVIVQFHHFEDSDTFSDGVQLQHFEDSDTFSDSVQLQHFEDSDTFSDSVQLQHFENSDAFRAFWAILVLLTQAQGKPKSFES